VSQVHARSWLCGVAGVALVAAGLTLSAGRPAEARTKVEVQVAARKYAYRVSGLERPEIHVHEGDVVRITFTTDDIPHSFTIDEPYRISKRAAPGKPVTFEFLADKPGTFAFYCNLALDDRCKKEVRGTLIVDARGNPRAR
jgi:heme/copper-type cytochrome/quinol oxidase subunit 2